jgi:hypothetical protein
MTKQKVFDYLKHGFTQDDVYIRLTPKNKKSINMMIQLYNVPVNEPNHRFVQVNEMYRWGFGYMEGDTLDYPNLILPQNGQTYCDPTVGHGSDLDDLCAVDFWYDGKWTEEQKKDFEDKWYNGDPDDDDGRSGMGWIYDYQDTWQIEDEQIIIDGGVKYDIVSKTEHDKILIEDYKPVIDENI